MKLLGQIRSVAYFQANALRIVKDIAETRNPVILTTNGEGRVILQDLQSFDEAQEAIRLLRCAVPARSKPSRGRRK